MKYILTFLILIYTSDIIWGQIGFTDKTTNLPSPGFFSWMQKGVSDMNNDGLDDIVRADINGNFFILTQQVNNVFISKSLGSISTKIPLSIILGDLDNNNINDILTGGEYNGVRVILSNSDASNYNVSRLPQDSIFTQASALADIDNDGLLDAFVCNDDGINRIWLNKGNGNFVRDTTLFDFSTVPAEKLSGNYGIVFTDFDNDGDLDAYLSKCKAEAIDPTDPRRINQLFVNDGHNHYTDQASLFGLKDDNQSWITEFQDIDNDGDMDALIANHHSPSRLLENDGSGHFTEITTAAGLAILPDGILQLLMRDFDNDGYVDLMCASISGAKLYKNNGDKTFTEQSLSLLNPNTNETLRAFIVGDLNNDGFQDIYASYAWGTESPDRLWINNKNNNHYLKVRLKGSVSNRSGVGARIMLTVNGKALVREVRAGESYGISNSLTQFFGLGTTQKIDNLLVSWPSGYKTNISNVTVDQLLTINEPSFCKCMTVTVSKKL